jgi:hypothetical protein
MMIASSSTKAGSKDARPSCAMPISGVLMDWCAPPSGARSRRGRAARMKARVLVAGVVQRIEAAIDERVVERADRDEPLTEMRMREPESERR